MQNDKLEMFREWLSFLAEYVKRGQEIRKFGECVAILDDNILMDFPEGCAEGRRLLDELGIHYTEDTIPASVTSLWEYNRVLFEHNGVKFIIMERAGVTSGY